MKNEKDINVNMVRVIGDVAMFVKVDYMDKDAREHTGLFLVDSGCMDNILRAEMEDTMNPRDISEDETVGIQTITHSVVDAKMATFSFVLGGMQFYEGFCIQSCSFPTNKLGDIPFIGILGNTFMRQHRLVVDYVTASFTTPDTELSVSENW